MGLNFRFLVLLLVAMATLILVNCIESTEDEDIQELAEEFLDLIKKKRAISKNCGGQVVATDELKTFGSPTDSSNEYPSDLLCEWLIVAPAGKKVHLHFSLFDLEGRSWWRGGTCTDYVRIYDGSNDKGKPEGTYCGHETPDDFTSSGNTLFVQFKSDWNDDRRGFVAKYSSKGMPTSSGPSSCINEEKNNGGRLMPVRAGDYKPNMQCNWNINAPQGKRIKFHFHFFDLEDKLFWICYDSLSILDGPNLYSSSLLYTCGSTTPADIITSGSTALVVFRSDGNTQEAGFWLDYEYVSLVIPSPSPSTTPAPSGSTTTSRPSNLPAACQGLITTYTAQSGTISSPGFESKEGYQNNLRCRWSIVVDEGYIIRLTFDSFKVEEGEECYDGLVVYDGHSASSDIIDIFCGQSSTYDIVSTNNYLFLSFISDESNTERGFKLKYTAVKKNIWSTSPPPVSAPSRCGRNIHTRILGGEESEQGEWPWQVLIKVFQDYDYNYYAQCGGSLISENWVLSAAHCFENSKTKSRNTDPKLAHFYFGVVDQSNPERRHSKRKAAKIFIHPGRTEFEVAPHDIALVKLDSPVQLSDYVNLICLPPNSNVPLGTTVWVSGWGKSHHLGKPNIKLMHVTQTVISNRECKNLWNDNSVIHQDNLCAHASSQYKSSCQGDSGGPLVHRRGGVYELAGVVSWGNPCGSLADQPPSVYARVSSYLDWITNIMDRN